MPDSQESDWRALGFTSEVEFIEAEDEWEAVSAAFQRGLDAQRSIGPIALAAGDSLRQFANMLNEEPAYVNSPIDIRHGDYPRHDSYGDYWYDASGLHSNDAGACFTCKRPTHRMDIDLHGFFCNSTECNDKYREQIEAS